MIKQPEHVRQALFGSQELALQHIKGYLKEVADDYREELETFDPRSPSLHVNIYDWDQRCVFNVHISLHKVVMTLNQTGGPICVLPHLSPLRY